MADPGLNGGIALVPPQVGKTVDRGLVNSNKKLPVAPLRNHVIWIFERQLVDYRSTVEFDVVENVAIGDDWTAASEPEFGVPSMMSWDT